MASIEYLQNGRYALLKKLGEGGKGVVYKARDTVLDRVVAVKMLKSAVTEQEAYSRFMTEAQAVAKLNHPNIVSIYDIGKEDGKQFFVLEFVDGKSLRDLMETYAEGKCDIQTVLRIGIDICNALRYAHGQKVLHRDIKPENIMLNKESVAKLMDFGLAKMIGQPKLTQEGVIVGTVAYVAPEVALGKGADARSDLYSFGGVLYEALSGKPPFPGDDPIKIIFGHIHDRPIHLSKLNPEVPQALADCVMKLLEKDPEKRYRSFEELVNSLKEISENLLKDALAPTHKPSIVLPTPVLTGETQLVDRVEELNLLKEAVDGAIRGEGGVVFLHGEAGIGKTRLAREIASYSRLRGMQVLQGRCPPLFRMDGVPPYGLWSEVIKGYIETCSPEHLHRVVGFYPEEVAKLVPELRQKLGAVPQSLPISPEHEQNRLFEAVSQFIVNISRDSPLLVVLDDLQWTDPSSLLLLHYIARGIYRTSLLLLGVYRSTDIDSKHPLTPILRELNRERLPHFVSLKRLSLNDISEMMKLILDQDDIPLGFCRLIYEKTRGNPFFAEEVVKSLKEEELIYREEDKWKITEGSMIEFPETVKGTVKARISRLNEECQNMLTLASFVGNDFGLQALSEATGIEESRLLEPIDELIETGLIKHRVVRGEDLCSFADVIVRDVLYEETGPFKRKKLHDIVGHALERVYAETIDEHFGELALHFLESGDKDKALDYFLKAGEKASMVYANIEAVSYFESALRLLEEREGDLREKARILEKLGDIENLVEGYTACMKYWNEALLLWEQLGAKETTARLHRKMAFVLYRSIGDTEEGKMHHEEALKILEKEPESVELAILFNNMADMYWRTENMAKARSWAEKALELANRLNAYDAVAVSYNVLSAVLAVSGEDRKRAIEYAERSLKIALDNGFTEIALWGYNDVAVDGPEEENERSLELLEKGYELAKKVGAIFWVSFIGNDLSWAYFHMGNMDKAFLLAEESALLSRKAGNIRNLGFSTSLLGFFCQVLGEWDKSEQYQKEAFSLSQKGKDNQRLINDYTHLGWLYFEKEEYVKAKEQFEKAIEICEKRGSKYYTAMGARSWDDRRSHWAVLNYIELGEIEKAKKMLDDMSKLAVETEDKLLIASADATRATLFRAQKKWQESFELFEKSLQEFDALNARQRNVYQLALVLYDYGKAYLQRNEEGDRGKAHSLLNQALELFQKLGAKKNIEKIIAKKKLLTA